MVKIESEEVATISFVTFRQIILEKGEKIKLQYFIWVLSKLFS